MPIVILVLAAVAYLFVLVAYPEYRKIALAAGGAAVAGLGAYFWFTEPEAARAGLRIEPREITIEGLEIEPSARGATLRGRVINGSDRYRLREMALTLRMRDCPDDEVPVETCPVIGEATAIARPDAPPGQIRAFVVRYTFPNLAPATGIRRWDWSLGEIRATN
jgi:hypothetical protein